MRLKYQIIKISMRLKSFLMDLENASQVVISFKSKEQMTMSFIKWDCNITEKWGDFFRLWMQESKSSLFIYWL